MSEIPVNPFARSRAAMDSAYGGGAFSGSGVASPDAGGASGASGPGWREKFGSGVELAKRGGGRFAEGLINSTVKNPSFWYSTLTAATITGLRAAAMHAGAGEAGEFGVVALGVVAGGLKEGVTELFFKSKDKKRAAAAVLSGAIIGGLSAYANYDHPEGIGVMETTGLGMASTLIKKMTVEGRGVFTSPWKTIRDLVVSGITTGAISGAAEWWRGPIPEHGSRAGAPASVEPIRTYEPPKSTDDLVVIDMPPSGPPASPSPGARVEAPAPTNTPTPTATSVENSSGVGRPGAEVAATNTATPTATLEAAKTTETPFPTPTATATAPETITPSATTTATATNTPTAIAASGGEVVASPAASSSPPASPPVSRPPEVPVGTYLPQPPPDRDNVWIGPTDEVPSSLTTGEPIPYVRMTPEQVNPPIGTPGVPTPTAPSGNAEAVSVNPGPASVEYQQVVADFDQDLDRRGIYFPAELNDAKYARINDIDDITRLHPTTGGNTYDPLAAHNENGTGLSDRLSETEAVEIKGPVVPQGVDTAQRLLDLENMRSLKGLIEEKVMGEVVLADPKLKEDLIGKAIATLNPNIPDDKNLIDGLERLRNENPSSFVHTDGVHKKLLETFEKEAEYTKLFNRAYLESKLATSPAIFSPSNPDSFIPNKVDKVVIPSNIGAYSSYYHLLKGK